MAQTLTALHQLPLISISSHTWSRTTVFPWTCSNVAWTFWLCNPVFNLLYCSYSSDSSKTFLIGALNGTALRWTEAYPTTNPLEKAPYSTFLSDFKKGFDHALGMEDAACNLLILTEGNRSVSYFSNNFHILSTEAGWNEETLNIAFTDTPTCHSLRLSETQVTDKPGWSLQNGKNYLFRK